MAEERADQRASLGAGNIDVLAKVAGKSRAGGVMALEVSIRDSRAGDHRKGLGRRIMYGPEKPQKCWRFVLSRIIIFKFQVLYRSGPSLIPGRVATAKVLEIAKVLVATSTLAISSVLLR